MQTVSPRFNTLANGDVRPSTWGTQISFTKAYDDNVTFFTYDVSAYNGPDVYAPVNDNPLQAWDKYAYSAFGERVIDMSVTREFTFPYSIVSAIADFTLNNYDGYFTPDTAPRAILETNHSKNPSFELGSGTVEVRRNVIVNPNLSGLVLGSTGAGITISVPTPNERRVVINNPTGNYWSIVPFLGDSALISGATYTMSLEIKRTGGGSTPPTMYLTPTTGYKASTGSVGTDWSTIYVTFTNGACTAFQAHLGWSGVTNGTYDVRRFKLEQIGTLLPYFDGTTNDGFDTASLTPSWTGTASNSASILTGQAVLGAESRAASTSPMWLSSDGANHGASFARSLVYNSRVASAYTTTDTDGVASGELRTSSLTIRHSRGATIEKRWRTSNGNNFSYIGDQTLLANTWTELKATASPATNNANLGVFISTGELQAGDIVDIDNHYVVKGNYTGTYFDGNSGGDYGWQGASNNSVSHQYEHRPGIGHYILPKRPVRLFQGFDGENLQQFVGLTQGMPEVDERSATASFTAMDFLTQIYEMPIRNTQAMRDVRTDEVLAEIFTQFGLAPSQYDLSTGRNVIKFLFFEKDQLTAGDVIRPLIQAEGGALWLGEDGIIRFRPRLEQPTIPVYSFDEDSIVSATVTDEDQLINSVIINTDVREVQEWQTVYSKKTSDSTLNVIPAFSTYVYQADLQDPLLDAVAPVFGENAGVSWFTAALPDGTPVLSGLSVVSTEMKTNTYEITIANNNGVSVNINQMSIWGQPAKKISVEPIVYRNKDQDSVDKYEEQVLEISNNFIQSIDSARSFAYTILDEYSEYADVVEFEVKGNAALQLSDIIDVSYTHFTNLYRIIAIRNKLQGSKFTQILKCRRRSDRTWFQYDVSEYNGSDVYAP